MNGGGNIRRLFVVLHLDQQAERVSFVALHRERDCSNAAEEISAHGIDAYL